MIRGRKGGKEEERGQDMGREKESRKLISSLPIKCC